MTKQNQKPAQITIIIILRVNYREKGKRERRSRTSNLMHNQIQVLTCPCTN